MLPSLLHWALLSCGIYLGRVFLNTDIVHSEKTCLILMGFSWCGYCIFKRKVWFSLDPSYWRGRVYKLKFYPFVCLSVHHRFHISNLGPLNNLRIKSDPHIMHSWKEEDISFHLVTRAAEVVWRSPILSWPTIMFSKRVCYDLFNRRDKCRKIECLEEKDCSWLPFNKHAINIFI